MGAGISKAPQATYIAGSPMRVHVKNTFLEVEEPLTQSMQRVRGSQWGTAPPEMLHHSFHTMAPPQADQADLSASQTAAPAEAHYRGECKPCAYHVYKADGCRQGAACPFCHLCTRGEIKRRKRERAKSMKAGEAVHAG